MTVAIHPGTSGGVADASITSTAVTTSLSASGSRYWPSTLIVPCRLASQPSKKSVRHAARKRIAAPSRGPSPSSRSRMTMPGTSATRARLSTFGSRPDGARPTTLAAAGDDTGGIPQIRQAIAQNAPDALLRLGDGRNSPRLLHPLGPRVVRRQRQDHVPPIAIEQHAQMPAPTLDVVLRQEHVADAVQGGRLRHE